METPFSPDAERRASYKRRSLRLLPQSGPARVETEAFMVDVNRRKQAPHVMPFMPVVLGMRDSDGELTAACGLRPAHGVSLFLEWYLHCAAESAIHRATGIRVARDAIAEIGAFAVAPTIATRELIAGLTRYLASTPFAWIVFIAPPHLRNAFARLGIPVASLANPGSGRSPAPVAEDRRARYEHGPCAVCVEDSRTALDVLKGLPG